jgi:hypothetical protein
MFWHIPEGTAHLRRHVLAHRGASWWHILAHGRGREQHALHSLASLDVHNGASYPWVGACAGSTSGAHDEIEIH